MTPDQVRIRRELVNEGRASASAILADAERAEQEVLLAHAYLDGCGAPAGDLRERVRSVVVASEMKQAAIGDRLNRLAAAMARALSEVTG